MQELTARRVKPQESRTQFGGGKESTGASRWKGKGTPALHPRENLQLHSNPPFMFFASFSSKDLELTADLQWEVPSLSEYPSAPPPPNAASQKDCQQGPGSGTILRLSYLFLIGVYLDES